MGLLVGLGPLLAYLCTTSQLNKNQIELYCAKICQRPSRETTADELENDLETRWARTCRRCIRRRHFSGSATELRGRRAKSSAHSGNSLSISSGSHDQLQVCACLRRSNNSIAIAYAVSQSLSQSFSHPPPSLPTSATN